MDTFPIPRRSSRPHKGSRRLAAAPPLAILLGGTLLPGCGYDHGPPGLWDDLSRTPTEDPSRFDPTSLEGLPEPARRYLARAITPGTPLARSVTLTMEGTIVLDPARPPVPMTAEQVLTPPMGFVWSARTQGGMMRIRGFDRLGRGEGEMRWKLFGLIPVMRARGEDVTRSAAARLGMEAVLLPSALVPGGPYRWEAVDDHHARYIITILGETVSTTLEVDPEGRPLRAWADRWNEGKYERFEVRLSEEFEAGGYRLPGRIVAGWRLGDPDAYPFFDARLTGAAFR